MKQEPIRHFPWILFPQEYTAYGNGDYRINGLETEQADGSDTANLKYDPEISKENTGTAPVTVKSTGSDQPGWL
ncbi:MAG: hypothetical protein ACLVEO_12725 [Lachnospiraceae bacterium]